MNNFYTYAYLREDGTPYYIGKGRGRRAYEKGNRKVKPPANRDRILILKKNLTESEAFKHEVYMIFVFGRKHTGTGILMNFTEGGEGVAGLVHTEESREKMRKAKQAITGETRERLRKSHLGHEVSPETREKISRSGKGRLVSVETREKIRRANLGKKKGPFSKEHKEKIRQSVLLTLQKKLEEKQ